MTNPPSILVIEDEAAIADTILYALSTDGMAVAHCALGGAALERLRAQVPDLVILDVGLPDINGFEVCRTLRTFSDVPVIFLTARNEEIDRIVGLEIGADDYVVKPFSPRELAARVRVILRRAGMQAAPRSARPAASGARAGCRAGGAALRLAARHRVPVRGGEHGVASAAGPAHGPRHQAHQGQHPRAALARGGGAQPSSTRNCASAFSLGSLRKPLLA
ncbi:response regulator [Cupriavidus sp. 30B13]|uniref:response regulator n=1 Tax=Cupriavidus sp. 30B13 TaxID=3384241 RepID=UPI003B8FECF3